MGARKRKRKTSEGGRGRDCRRASKHDYHDLKTRKRDREREREIHFSRAILVHYLWSHHFPPAGPILTRYNLARERPDTLLSFQDVSARRAGRLRSGLSSLGINFWLLPIAVNYSGQCIHPARTRYVGHRHVRNESLCCDYEVFLSRLTGDCVQLYLSSFQVPTCWYLHKLWGKQLYSRCLRNS